MAPCKQEWGMILACFCFDFGQIWSNVSTFTPIPIRIGSGEDHQWSGSIKIKKMKKTLQKVKGSPVLTKPLSKTDIFQYEPKTGHRWISNRDRIKNIL